VYVIAQVRISPVESIRKNIPEIQDEFRHKGFPRFLESEIPNLRIRPNSAPEFTASPAFEFQDRTRQAGIVVGKDFVSVHLSRYTGFEELCSFLSLALGTVSTAVEPALVERVGLRYINLIRPAPEEQLSDYVHCGLLGLDTAGFAARNSRMVVQMLSTTDHGTLAIRFLQRDDGVLLPPDIHPSLSYPDPAPELRPGEVISLLDFDHFKSYEDRSAEFSLESQLELFWRLHNNIDLAFLASVTPHAMKVWGAK
jgi:uncharacterized protein (TIGR04255 family)